MSFGGESKEIDCLKTVVAVVAVVAVADPHLEVPSRREQWDRPAFMVDSINNRIGFLNRNSNHSGSAGEFCPVG